MSTRPPQFDMDDPFVTPREALTKARRASKPVAMETFPGGHCAIAFDHTHRASIMTLQRRWPDGETIAAGPTLTLLLGRTLLSMRPETAKSLHRVLGEMLKLAGPCEGEEEGE